MKNNNSKNKNSKNKNSNNRISSRNSGTSSNKQNVIEYKGHSDNIDSTDADSASDTVIPADSADKLNNVISIDSKQDQKPKANRKNNAAVRGQDRIPGYYIYFPADQTEEIMSLAVLLHIRMDYEFDQKQRKHSSVILHDMIHEFAQIQTRYIRGGRKMMSRAIQCRTEYLKKSLKTDTLPGPDILLKQIHRMLCIGMDIYRNDESTVSDGPLYNIAHLPDMQIIDSMLRGETAYIDKRITSNGTDISDDALDEAFEAYSEPFDVIEEMRVPTQHISPDDLYDELAQNFLAVFDPASIAMKWDDMFSFMEDVEEAMTDFSATLYDAMDSITKFSPDDPLPFEARAHGKQIFGRLMKRIHEFNIGHMMSYGEAMHLLCPGEKVDALNAVALLSSLTAHSMDMIYEPESPTEMLIHMYAVMNFVSALNDMCTRKTQIQM